MLGFIFGTLCLIGLVVTLRRGPRWHHAHGFGHGRWGHHHGGYHGGRRNWLRGLFLRLDTTPGQEKAIVAALEGLRERGRGLRSELGSARKRVAEALGGEVLDREALDAAFNERAGAIDTLREELTKALDAVHAALDPKQRTTLAELIADGSFGPFGGRGGFGYGHDHPHHHYAHGC
jgi:Spy/CpxP family protein refolding chaperone